MTKRTNQPVGKPASKIVIGKEADKEVQIEDKAPVEPVTFVCGACSGRMEKQYVYCPLCGVNLRWE